MKQTCSCNLISHSSTQPYIHISLACFIRFHSSSTLWPPLNCSMPPSLSCCGAQPHDHNPTPFIPHTCRYLALYHLKTSIHWAVCDFCMMLKSSWMQYKGKEYMEVGKGGNKNFRDQCQTLKLRMWIISNLITPFLFMVLLTIWIHFLLSRWSVFWKVKIMWIWNV